jgi:hypothetical protein
MDSFAAAAVDGLKNDPAENSKAIARLLEDPACG